MSGSDSRALTSDDRCGEGAAGDGSDGGSTSNGKGGALQKHGDVDCGQRYGRCLWIEAGRYNSRRSDVESNGWVGEGFAVV